jgi:hypothetical protein
MTTLISPANKQPCEFVAARDGFVCLRQDYVSPQVRWFPIEAIEAVNPVYCYPMPAPENETLILEPTPELVGRHWQLSVNRADQQLVAMYERHYSCYQYKDGRKRTQAVAPGKYIALMTVNRDALFIWSQQKYRADKQQGINCAVFRNESNILSSDLITEAVEIAQRRWPGERLFTFVDGSKITSANPGYCFKKAGWKRCGTTAAGLLIFEWKRPKQLTVQLPTDMLKDVDAKLSLGVQIVVRKAADVSLWCDEMRAA